jgi:hypothetical protein
MKKTSTLLGGILLFLIPFSLSAATVVATVNGTPITDRDITARVRLMALQGDNRTDNRIRALSNIIDDNIKLNLATQMQISPADAEITREIDAMKSRGFDTSGLDSVGMEMVRFAVRANIAWQMTIGRTIMPTVNVTEQDIQDEIAELSRTRGLPINVTLLRLVNIPEDIAAKLTAPKDCADAERMARSLGGAPIRLTAPEFELSEEVRRRIADLPELSWSSRDIDRSVLLVCSRTRMPEYGTLDDVVRQNAIFKRAMFIGDQQLNQQRRRAVIVINNPKYRGAIN